METRQTQFYIINFFCYNSNAHVFLFSDKNTPGQVDEEVDGDVRIGVVQFCRLCHLQAGIFLRACTYWFCSMYAWVSV